MSKAKEPKVAEDWIAGEPYWPEITDPKSHVFHRRLDYDYPTIKRGKGMYLYDKKGRKYIDAASGAAVVSIGHCFPGVSESIKELAEKITYVHGAQFTTDIMENYARDLCSLSDGLYNKVFFVSGGSEGVESAVKLARQFHRNNGNSLKYKLISRWPSYHGSTIGALSLTGKASARAYYMPYLHNVTHIQAPFCYHCPFDEKVEDCNVPCAYELDRVINRIGAEHISAFVFEPVIGASAGVVIPPRKYYDIISRICRDNNILTISDEVMCGFGRTGEWFASRHFGISPDITVMGKGISGGYVPLAAVFCNDRIYNIIKNISGSFSHGFTFENTPFCAGVGQIVLSATKRFKCVENSRRMGPTLKKGLVDELSSHENIGDIRGIGLFCAVEIVEDKRNKMPFKRESQISEKLVTFGMGIGINLYFAIGFMPNGDGDAILFAPPLNIERNEIDEIVKLGTKAVKETLDNISTRR